MQYSNAPVKVDAEDSGSASSMKSDSLRSDTGEMGTFASSRETRRTICEMGEEKGMASAILAARLQLQLAPSPALRISFGRGIATTGANRQRKSEGGRSDANQGKCTSTKAV